MTHIQKTPLKDLNLSSDFLFSQVMQDTEICKLVLEKILNIEIKTIKHVTQQKFLKMSSDSKAIYMGGPHHLQKANVSSFDGVIF